MGKATGLKAKLTQPARRHPTFFVGLVALLSVAPVWATLFAGAHIYRFTLACMLESIAVAYLACLLLCAVGDNLFSKVLKWIIILLASAWTVAECGTVGSTGAPINQAAVNLVFDTDQAEISGFFSQYFGLKAILALLAIPIWVIGAVIASRLVSRSQQLRTFISGALLLCVVAGIVLICRIGAFATIHEYDRLLEWVGQGSNNPELIHYYELDYTTPPVKIAYIAKINGLENREIEAFDRLQSDIYQRASVSADTTRKFNVLVIIGESMIRQHSSLYGYRLPTNPKLEAERDSGRLVVFSDIMTTANYTTPSIRNLLSTADIDRGERWTDGAFFPMILKMAGMDVSIFDNQLTDSRTDTGLGRVLYSPLNMTKVYSHASDSLFDYDGEFVRYANSRICPDTLTRQCIIYHLKGQHFDAADRFDTAPRFTAADITAPEWLTEERRKDIANYDSATYYNDSIVCELLRPWSGVPTVAFYFSDHGEDIADLGETGARNKPRPDDPAWVDRQFHVPFMVWMSDSFINGYPALATAITASAETPESLDHLGVNIFRLLGINYQYNH